MVGWEATDLRDGASVVSAITTETPSTFPGTARSQVPLESGGYDSMSRGRGAGRFRGGFGRCASTKCSLPIVVLSASFGRSIERPWGSRRRRSGVVQLFRSAE